ncbi:hypothetical protein FB446DRAFT_790630 [Lentinula raphanica]|nr:hypothetical protein FB446DRAFT_790630 [Lentinula raphanica]KAJ3820836.1 hypothetical protein F5880DRAFT_1615214 [Lentinula raphanica]
MDSDKLRAQFVFVRVLYIPSQLHNNVISVEPFSMGSVGPISRAMYESAPGSTSSAQSPEQTDPSWKAAAPRPLPQGDYGPGQSRYFITFKKFILVDIALPRILLNAGVLSYLMFTLKTFWRFLLLFRSQPYTASVGFIVPSVAMYAFVQRYSPGRPNAEVGMRIPQAAVDVTILAGTFICTFILWLLVSAVGDLGAMLFLAFTFGTRYLPSSWS